MEPKANYTIVGLFVIILTGIIITATIWLYAGFDDKDYRTYRVLMNESVTGLSTEATVKYNGVDVGMVKQMRLNPQNPQQVELLLNIEDNIPVTRSTVAVLSMQGITGAAFIDLKTNGHDNRPLMRLPGERYPLIASGPSFFLRLDTALNQLMTNFNDMSNSMRALLNKDNLDSLHASLLSIQVITKDLENNTQHIDTILQNTATAAKGLPQLVQDGHTTLQNFNNQTIPKLNSILENFKHLSNNLVGTSRDVKQNPSILIRGQTTKPAGPGE